MPGGFRTLLHFTFTRLSNEHYNSHFIKRETQELRDRANQHRTVKSKRIGPAPRLGSCLQHFWVVRAPFTSSASAFQSLHGERSTWRTVQTVQGYKVCKNLMSLTHQWLNGGQTVYYYHDSNTCTIISSSQPRGLFILRLWNLLFVSSQQEKERNKQRGGSWILKM